MASPSDSALALVTDQLVSKTSASSVSISDCANHTSASSLMQVMLAQLPATSDALKAVAAARVPVAEQRLRAVKRKAEVELEALMTEVRERMHKIASGVQASVSDLDEAAKQAQRDADKCAMHPHPAAIDVSQADKQQRMNKALTERLWTVSQIEAAIEADADNTQASAPEEYDSDGTDGDELMSEPVLVRMSFALWNDKLASKSGTSCLKRPVKLVVMFANRSAYKACKVSYTGMHDADDIRDEIIRAAALKYLKAGEKAEDWDMGEDLRYGSGNGMAAWFHNEQSMRTWRYQDMLVDLLVTCDEEDNISTSSRFFVGDDTGSSQLPMTVPALAVADAARAVVPL